MRAAHPAAAISVVGVPSYRDGNNKRLTQWNEGLFSALTGGRAGDGVTMHEYDPTGAGAGSTFTAADVPVMLGTPFAVAARINQTAIPPGFSIWITEYNLLYSDGNPKPDVPAFGTWAHALFVTLETLLLLDVPAVAAGRVNKHCLSSYAYSGALFLDTTSFDFPLSPDNSAPTQTWGTSGPGAALALLGAAMRGATATTALAFSPNPPVHPASGAAYPSLVGHAFVGGAGGGSALVVNLADTATTLTSGLEGYSTFTTLAAAGKPTGAVNNDAKLARAAGKVSPGAGVALPAYSVLLLSA